MLEEIPVSNVLISIMFMIGVKKLVFLMSVLYKTVINVKLILKSVNNVRVEQFRMFQQEDAQQRLSINVGQLVSAKMEPNAGIATMGSKLIISHGKIVKEFARTQTVWIVLKAPLSVKSVPMDMVSEMSQIQKIGV